MIPLFLDSFIERLGDAALYSLLAMGIIFTVLALLWGVLALFNRVFAKPKAKPEAEEVDVLPTEAPPDDGAIVAVLAAAINIILAEEAAAKNTEPPEFRVVSFRRAGSAQKSKSDK